MTWLFKIFYYLLVTIDIRNINHRGRWIGHLFIILLLFQNIWRMNYCLIIMTTNAKIACARLITEMIVNMLRALLTLILNKLLITTTLHKIWKLLLLYLWVWSSIIHYLYLVSRLKNCLLTATAFKIRLLYIWTAHLLLLQPLNLQSNLISNSLLR